MIKSIFAVIRDFIKANLKLHKEGKVFVINLLVWLLIINGFFYFIQINDFIFGAINLISIGLFIIVLYFFRNPIRIIEAHDDNLIYAPADGKIVVIEQTTEKEYFNEPRIQISIFMSPLDVHVNRIPVSGEIKYCKYHDGHYLVAWHPKSSTHNERTTVVLETPKGVQILIRQIAGAIARRVVCYAEVGKQFEQGQDLGFIKFGSRVDVFIPIDSELFVNIGDRMVGNKSIIARLK